MGGAVRAVTRVAAPIIKPVTKLVGGVVTPLIAGTTAAVGEGLSALGITGKSDKSKIYAALPDVAEPGYPGFDSLLDETGALPSQYQLQTDPQAMEQLRTIATEDVSQNPWLQMRQQEIGDLATQQRADIGARGQTAVESAKQGLAMRGGLRASDSDAFEQERQRQELLARQNIARGEQVSMAGAQKQAEEFKQQALSALPGLEMQQLQPQQFNIQQTLKEKELEEQAKSAAFQEQMRAWAAKKTGVGIQQSGGGKK